MFSLQRLLGKEDKFFNLLEASGQEARTSVQALVKLIANPKAIKSLDQFVESRRKEKQIAIEISDALCTTFITAFEREDIEALSQVLYKIPKTIEKIGERILIAPHLVEGEDFSRQTTMMQNAIDIVILMIKQLRDGIDISKMNALNTQLQKIEGEADKLMIDLLREIYTGNQDVRKTIFLKDIHELIEKVIDRCRDAGNVLNHIVLKNS